MPVLFPQDPTPDYIFNAPNGVDYQWDASNQAWIIVSDPEVTKEYVDYQDSYRVSRFGDSMINHLKMQTSFDEPVIASSTLGYDTAVDADTSETTYTSFLKFHTSQPYIDFTEASVAHIKFQGADYVTAGSSYINVYQGIKILTKTSAPHFITWDTSGVCYFLQNKRDKTVRVSLKASDTSRMSWYGDSKEFFRLSGSGKVTILSDSSNCFYVQKSTDIYGGKVPGGNSDGSDWSGNTSRLLTINADTYRIQSSKIYNDAIIAGSYPIIPPTGGDSVNQSFTADWNIATLGYVKAKRFHPGENLAASSEAECEVGGMWRSGSTYYIKIS